MWRNYPSHTPIVWLAATFSLVAPIFNTAQAQDTAELIEVLNSFEHGVWQDAAEKLGRLETVGIDAVIDAYRSERLHGSHLEHVFVRVRRTESLEKLCRLLFDRDERIRSESFYALERYATSDTWALKLLPSLQKVVNERQALKAEERDKEEEHGLRRAEYFIALITWKIAPTRESAEEIIVLARQYEGDSISYIDSFFRILDNPIGHALMSDQERLKYLVMLDLQADLGGPSVLNYRLTYGNQEQNVFSEPDVRELVERNRAALVEDARTKLVANGDSISAMILGYFKDEESLPTLRSCFIRENSFYGWESSTPDDLAWNQYIGLHAYEEAIQSITGEPIEAFFELSRKEKRALKKECREGKRAALYKLYRFEPDIARKEAIRKYNNVAEWERFNIALMLYKYFLKESMSRRESIKMFGKPDEVKDNVSIYYLGENPIAHPAELHLIFDGKALEEHEIKLLPRKYSLQ